MSITIVSGVVRGGAPGTRTFEPLEFLARLLARVPRKGEIYVRLAHAVGPVRPVRGDDA